MQARSGARENRCTAIKELWNGREKGFAVVCFDSGSMKSVPSQRIDCLPSWTRYSRLFPLIFFASSSFWRRPAPGDLRIA